jgi:adenylate cyclase
MKYGVVGSHVNLTSRVESSTVGGQILISEATRQESGPILKIARRIEVQAKGVGKPLALYDVRGIGGEYELFLPERDEEFVQLSQGIPLRYSLLEGKHLGRTVFEGRFVKLSVKGGEIHSDNPVPMLSDIKIQLIDVNGEEIPGDLYGKVVEQLLESRPGFAVRFTSVPSESAILRLLRHRPMPSS